MRRSKVKEENKLETTYKTTITYNCPKRGLVTEEVEVKKYKATEIPDDPSRLIFDEIESSVPVDEDQQDDELD